MAARFLTAATAATAALSWTVGATVTASSSTPDCVAIPEGAVSATVCNGKKYVYQELAGAGTVASDARDKFGDTLGSLGSSIAIDRKSWKKNGDGTYSGVMWTLPDRGWNTEGTLNYVSRVHKFGITLTPSPDATVSEPSSPDNLQFEYQDTILFRGPDGKYTTGLDADGSGHLSYDGFPDLPVATYTGDGFGTNTSTCPGKKQRIPVDGEGLWLNDDGSFWVSDEYGPYIYHFDETGRMTTAIRPNDAIVPMRNGSESFSADSPPHYINGGEGHDVVPHDNPTGRGNNHGLEGLTLSPDGKKLYSLLQEAANQEGGSHHKKGRANVRLIEYDIADPFNPKYEAEYVVALPHFIDLLEIYDGDASDNPKTAAQSEIHSLPNGQFLILARDSKAGYGQKSTYSTYRHIDLFDISEATDVKSDKYDCTTCQIASDRGVLNEEITPAELCSFLDFNINEQLTRFSLHNGGPEDPALLSEKWESIAVVPVDPEDDSSDDYFVFSVSDNDFITQNGFMNFGRYPYADSSGYNMDTQALVFKVTIPK